MPSAAPAARDTPPKDWVARFVAERTRLQLYYCNLFRFWRACRDKRCRRHRRCCGDANACLKKRIGEISRDEQFAARQALLAATPQNVGSAVRTVRELMAYDVITPEPMPARLGSQRPPQR